MKPLLLSALVLPLFCANAQETGKLTIEIPAAVQQTIAKEKGESGKVIEFKRLNENDGATYAITLEIDGKPYEMILDAAGRVMRKELITSESEEKEVDIHQLPDAIKKTFYREATGVALKIVRVREEKKRYSANIVINRRKYVIEVDAAGKLIAKRFDGDEEEN
jgi:hypothetical protein